MHVNDYMVSTQERQRLKNASMELDLLLIYLFPTDIHDSVKKGLLPLSVHGPGCILTILSNCSGKEYIFCSNCIYIYRFL
jgi:hypothetical protein